jgi:hypothetical protein
MKKEDESMFKIAAIAVCVLFICGMTFLAVPSAFGFEDYIFVETAVQEEIDTNELPEAVGGSYYEEIKDDVETLEEQATLEQEEMQETEQPLYEEEQEEIR